MQTPITAPTILFLYFLHLELYSNLCNLWIKHFYAASLLARIFSAWSAVIRPSMND